jgi:hypothetical protein
MQRELYFDINAEDSGGSLYRIGGKGGPASFIYNHSTYDDARDEVKVFETHYPDFAAFWRELIKDPTWFYRHPYLSIPNKKVL